MEDLISIIIPLFNRENLVLDTLKSIREQSYVNWECIIVDDHSTDNSFQVATQFAAQDLRFRVFKRTELYKNGGNGARNYGYSLAQGEFIKWFDSDDIMETDFLKTQITFLKNNPSYDFVSSEFYYFTNQYKEEVKLYKNPKQNNIEAYLLFSHYFPTPAPLWRAKFLKNKKLWNEEMLRAQEAYFNFLRLTEKPTYKILPYSLFGVRRGHESIESLSSKDKSYKTSVLFYFTMVLEYLIKNKKDFSPRVLRYQFYRVITTYYEVINLSGMSTYYMKMWSYLKDVNMNIIDKTRFAIGLLLIKYLGKGYFLICNSKFDARDNRFIEN